MCIGYNYCYLSYSPVIVDGIELSSPAVTASIAVAAAIPVVGVLSFLLTLLAVHLCTRCRQKQPLPSEIKDPLRASRGRNWIRSNQSSLTQNAAYIRSADQSVVFSGVYECVVDT